jgi:hypothetical protein
MSCVVSDYAARVSFEETITSDAGKHPYQSRRKSKRPTVNLRPVSPNQHPLNPDEVVNMRRSCASNEAYTLEDSGGRCGMNGTVQIASYPNDMRGVIVIVHLSTERIAKVLFQRSLRPDELDVGTIPIRKINNKSSMGQRCTHWNTFFSCLSLR